MKKLILAGFLMTLMLWVEASPAAVPKKRNNDRQFQIRGPVQPRFTTAAGKKNRFLQRAAVRAIERKMVRKFGKSDEGTLKQKRTLGLISLLSGIVGIITLFTVPVIGIVLIPTALITGIVGLSNNTDKRSRTHSIIGLVLGGIGIFATILALIYVLTFGWL